MLDGLRPLTLSPLHKIGLHQHQVQAETGDPRHRWSALTF
jgi:hypothetical protein